MKFKVGDEVIVIKQLPLSDDRYRYINGYIFTIGIVDEYEEYSEAGDRSFYTMEECIRLVTPLDKLL